MSTIVYYPEMGEAKPAAEISANLSHYGKHYFLRTRLELKTGRSCVKLESSQPGINRYQVTIREYERLEKIHTISYEMLLD